MLNRLRSLFSRPPRGGYPRKVDLSADLGGFYGQHRSGWPFVLGLLSRLHDPRGMVLDTFIERTFCWHPGGPRAHKKPWIGFIHVPPGVPDWFVAEQSNQRIFQSPLWKESLPGLQGLYTLSDYHRQALQPQVSVPVENLIFPTETPELTWTPDRFLANRDRRIVQVGWWLRRLHAIYLLPGTRYRKTFLRITHADIDGLLARERQILLQKGPLPDDLYEGTESLSFLDNEAFDQLLSENLVFIELYDSSANNTVIECIVRNTPILVNPLPSVREYLGEDYPLYFHSLEEAAAKAEDIDLLVRAHHHLVNLPIKEKLTGEFFLQSVVNSGIYSRI